MNKLLVTICAATVLTGPAFAQSPATKAQTPAATATSPTSGANQATGNNATNSNATNSNATNSGANASNPTGIQSMNSTGTVKMSFYTVQPADIRASKLMGAEVYNLQNENIGEIEDIIIDNGRNIRGVVVSVGGFLGIGDRNIAVQPSSLTTNEQNDGGVRVVINTNKEELKNAPQVKLEDIDRRASTDATGSTANSSANSATNRSSKQ